MVNEKEQQEKVLNSTELILLTNIHKVFEELETFGQLEGGFLKEYMSTDEEQLKSLFSERRFILSIINGDVAFTKSYFYTLINVLKETNFPALVLANKKNIKRYIGSFPITVDFLVKPVSRFEFNLRVTRIVEIFKIVKESNLLRNLEKEIDIRSNVIELSRQELLVGSETIKALDIAMEMARKELLDQKEEIMAREQVLEMSRRDEMDMLAQIKAFEDTLHYADKERMDYKKEIEALENLLVYMIRQKKEREGEINDSSDGIE